MSRLSQYLHFLNSDTTPSQIEKQTIYIDIIIDERLLKLRKEYKKKIIDKDKLDLFEKEFINLLSDEDDEFKI